MAHRRCGPSPWGLVVFITLISACSAIHQPVRYRFFAAARETDPWYEKVNSWQRRSQRESSAQPTARPPLTGSTVLLSSKMEAFETSSRRDLARRISDWTQRQAREHYRPERDVDNPDLDQWPTVGELLARDGDDCDGLDLIAYQLLLDFGFPRDEVYRVVVRRNKDGANHMVTVWFEHRSDPWVLDATGAMTRKLVRFSQISGWTPTRMFNQSRQFTIMRQGSPIAMIRE